jgi:alkylhydroperoxidase/carboxymuconolactone decarboxylase family protein YurZ
MAVLSKPSNGARSPSADLDVIVCADSAAMRRRISYALSEHELAADLSELDDPELLSKLELDEETIVVLACDVDQPREMAALRRLRREMREPAIVAVSPRATGTGVRRALDAGARPEEIVHTLLALTSTIGFPNVTAALSWAEDLLDQRK